MVIGMAQPQRDADPLNQMLLELAISTARLRAMVDETHALVQHLQNRPAIVSVKNWANETNPSRVQFTSGLDS